MARKTPAVTQSSTVALADIAEAEARIHATVAEQRAEVENLKREAEEEADAVEDAEAAQAAIVGAWKRGADTPVSQYIEATAEIVKVNARKDGRTQRIQALGRATDKVPTDNVVARAVAEVICKALSPDVRVIPTFVPDVEPTDAERAGGAVVVVQTLESEQLPEGPSKGMVMVTAFRPAWAGGMLSPMRVTEASRQVPDVSLEVHGDISTPSDNTSESIRIRVLWAAEAVPSIPMEPDITYARRWASSVCTTTLSRLSDGRPLRLSPSGKTWTTEVAEAGEVFGNIVSTSVKDGQRTTLVVAKFPLRGRGSDGRDAGQILPLVAPNLKGSFASGLGRITDIKIATKSPDNAFGWTNCEVTATFTSRVD